MILELSQICGFQPDLDGDLNILTYRMKELAENARYYLEQDRMKRILVIGEPLCVYKYAIAKRYNLFDFEARLISMPLSEALLFHLTDIDRDGKYKNQLSELSKIHHTVIGLTGDGVIYTALDRLFDADRGKLDFCVGDMARYRLAKLFCAESPFFSGVLMVQSNEENAGIIVNTLADEFEEDINIPLAVANLDFEHCLNEEDALSFIHSLTIKK